MRSIKIDFKCPNCKKKQRVKIYNEVTYEKIPEILDRTLFQIKCRDCNEVITLDYQILLDGKDYTLFYNPNKVEFKFMSNMKVKRVCYSFNDFKEKVLILEEGLNDILIEFIKEFLFRQLDDDIKSDVDEIRFNSLVDDELIFHLVGCGKSICCKQSFYDDLLKKSKFKNIEDFINIDSTNYHNYFKLV